MPQHGFFFDQSRCTGCQTCAVACKNWHGLPPGPVKFLRIYEYEKGSFPDVRTHFHWFPCYHCENPVCATNCPCEALYKEDKYGAVLINSESCDGCRVCYDVCPYGAPVFESDDLTAKVQKCDLCFERLEQGEKPVCVLSCPTRALDFGLLSTIRKRYGNRSELEDMPGSRTTKPSAVFKPHVAKRQLVPYHTERALELLMRREPLPPVFNSPADVLKIPEGMVSRSQLVVKHSSAADLMSHTRNDEG
ncbi:4Fe-4S dicluster domain-containing protein [Chloroflexota bacterium]